MTAKHFEAIADAIHDWWNANPTLDNVDVASLVSSLADICQASNSRFDRDRFFRACGLN
jgi:hypothetical protein